MPTSETVCSEDLDLPAASYQEAADVNPVAQAYSRKREESRLGRGQRPEEGSLPVCPCVTQEPPEKRLRSGDCANAEPPLGGTGRAVASAAQWEREAPVAEVRMRGPPSPDSGER